MTRDLTPDPHRPPRVAGITHDETDTTTMGIKAMFDTERGYEELIDEYGDSWSIVADDGAGNMAVERDAGERWEAGTFDGSEIGPAREGSTFGVSCQDEFIVRQTDQAGSLRRFEND